MTPDIHGWVNMYFPSATWRGDEADVLCPFHDDKTPSCGINAEKTVFNCLACGERGTLTQLAQRMGWDPPGDNGSRQTELARYDYRDAQGRILYQVVRFAPKDFRAYNPSTDEWSIKGIERVPYHLPELLCGIREGREIWITEGEKDVHTLERMGFIATTNQTGAKAGLKLWPSFKQSVMRKRTWTARVLCK